jgi:hypothetical protein
MSVGNLIRTPDGRLAILDFGLMVRLCRHGLICMEIGGLDKIKSVLIPFFDSFKWLHSVFGHLAMFIGVCVTIFPHRVK